MSDQRSDGRFRRVQLLDGAVEDLTAIAARSRTDAEHVLRHLKWLDNGQLTPTPLHDFAKTGDLRDCGKIVVAVEGAPEYRAVVRTAGDTIEVYEIVAIEDRRGDLPYLLAGVRLARIEDPVRKSDAERRIYRIRRDLDR